MIAAKVVLVMIGMCVMLFFFLLVTLAADIAACKRYEEFICQ